MKKIIFFSLIFALTLGVMPVLAEELTTVPEVNQIANDAINSVDQVAEITNQDLDNVNTGWFSGLWRNIQIWVTRDPLKKAKLELAQADVEMLKTKALAQSKLSDEELQARLDKANAKYNKIMAKVEAKLAEAKTKYPNNPTLNNLLEKFTDHQFKHQQILDRLEKQVPKEVAQRIENQREQHLVKFNEVMSKLENKEKFEKRIINSLSDNNVAIEHRIMRVKYIEELEKIDPELKAKLEAVKPEVQELWATMKSKHEAVIKSHQELRDKIEAQLKDIDPNELINNPEVRHELIQSIQIEAQKVRAVNKEIRDEARQQIETFKNEHQSLIDEVKNTVKPTVRKRVRPVITPQPVEPQPVDSQQPVRRQGPPVTNITY